MIPPEDRSNVANRCCNQDCVCMVGFEGTCEAQSLAYLALVDSAGKTLAWEVLVTWSSSLTATLLILYSIL